MLKKIDVYILRNLLSSFFISFLIITAVMMIGDIVKIYDILFARGSSLGVLIKILGYISIFLSIFTIPMALTIAINYVYTEMSNNSEITALRSSGINLYRVFLPSLAFSIVFFIILFCDISFIAYPSRLSYKNELEKTFRNKIYFSLKPGMFYNNLGGSLWVKSLSPNHKELYDTFFADKGKIFVAKKGKLDDIENGILATFYDVKMFSANPKGWEYGSFNKYQVAFLLKKKRSDNEKNVGIRYMTIIQLFNYYKKTHSREALFKINKMISLSLSIFPLSLIAFSFGITFSRGGKSGGIAVSLLFFFLFYILLMLGQSLFKSHGLIWPIYLPNIILMLFGFYVFYRKVKV